jgi:hypothetical protein
LEKEPEYFAMDSAIKAMTTARKATPWTLRRITALVIRPPAPT